MSSSAVSKKGEQQVSHPSRGAQMEAKEQSARANASAGLNLNVFGALSGAFSGKSKKTTETDGSMTGNREEEAHVKGAAMANMNANAAANAETKGREMRQAIKDGEA